MIIYVECKPDFTLVRSNKNFKKTHNSCGGVNLRCAERLEKQHCSGLIDESFQHTAFVY